MAERGGARPGAGRKKGSLTRRTQEIVAAAANQGESPLEYMLRIMRTAEDDKRRDAMAVAAAPFIHAKLAAVELSGNDEKPLVHEHHHIDATTFASRITGLATRESAGEGTGQSEPRN